LEVGGFVERERCYDDFSNLFYRYENITRSDKDGSGVLSSFYRNDLVKVGSMVSIDYRDSNYDDDCHDNYDDNDRSQ